MHAARSLVVGLVVLLNTVVVKRVFVAVVCVTVVVVTACVALVVLVAVVAAGNDDVVVLVETVVVGTAVEDFVAVMRVGAVVGSSVVGVGVDGSCVVVGAVLGHKPHNCGHDFFSPCVRSANKGLWQRPTHSGMQITLSSHVPVVVGSWVVVVVVVVVAVVVSVVVGGTGGFKPAASTEKICPFHNSLPPVA